MTVPVLEIENVSKTFFGTAALKSVSLSLSGGQILGLVGENGAGKSTLINILGGVLQPDGGQMRLGGEEYAPSDAAEAAHCGVSLVHQELNLFANLTIAENIFLTDFPRPGRLPWIDRRRLRDQTRCLLQSVRLSRDPDQRVEDLSAGEQQLVEIAKGLHRRMRVVVFDEPTTSLTGPEIERLFEQMSQLRDQGIAVIFISHTLEDVLRRCDRLAVLRDGALVAQGAVGEFTIKRLVSAMVGREMDQRFPPRAACRTDDPVLEVQGLSQPGVVEAIDLTLHRGEVLGLAGLMGSGRTELARILFGLDRYQEGTIRLCGEAIRPTPRRCMQRGMAFLTEDRRQEGLLLDATLPENLALPSLGEYRRGPWLDSKRLRAAAARGTAMMAVRRDPFDGQTVRTLSGGNQQKVVLAKWLLREPRVLLLDEPTRGIDIGAKFEIYRTINAVVAAGAAVLLISSEIEELIGLCDRILVMSRGTLVGGFERSDFDQEAILEAALGAWRSGPAAERAR